MEAARQKLLHAHYAGAVPQDLLASEMQRFTRELKEAELEIQAAKSTSEDIEATLEAALRAATNCHAAYSQAPSHIRKQINQGFFEKLYIGEDGSVEEAAFTEPFRALLDARQPITDSGAEVTTTETEPPADEATDNTAMEALSERMRPGAVPVTTWDDCILTTKSDHLNTRGDRAQMVAGVNVLHMVGMTVSWLRS